MIYSLTGIITEKAGDFIILETNGVGYQIFASALTLNDIHASEQEIKFYTYHHIREDQQVLFGFQKKEDRQLFITLISVSGLGPKVALKTLSAIKPDDIVQAILSENLAVLTSIPGIGKKMAERMIIELKDKLHTMYQFNVSTEKAQSIAISDSLQSDLTMALKTLGYSQDEIKKALLKSADSLTADISLEQGIKHILKNL